MKSLEKFIENLVKDFNELTTNDLQGIVMARCIQTGENEDEILEKIYKKVYTIGL